MGYDCFSLLVEKYLMSIAIRDCDGDTALQVIQTATIHCNLYINTIYLFNNFVSMYALFKVAEGDCIAFLQRKNKPAGKRFSVFL